MTVSCVTQANARDEANSASVRRNLRRFSGFSRRRQRRSDLLRKLEEVEAFASHAQVEVDEDQRDLHNGIDE